MSAGSRRWVNCRKLLAAAFVLCLMAVIGRPVHAQDPSIVTPQTAQPAFPRTPGGLFGPSPKIDRSQPLYLQGDELIYDSTGNRVTARGNVEIFFNNYILTADEVIYDRLANTLTARGNATLKEPNGNVVRSDQLTLTDDFRDGFVQSLSIVSRDNSRITARRAIRRGNVTEFEDGKFTPCKAKDGMPPLWCITAARVIHDQSQATITYQDAQFEILGVPVLGLPYFQHPDPSVKRKSGFLAPELSTSHDLGFMAEVPYYFALAPNYDLLFHPMYTTKQGVLWQADWRHRVAFGDITGQYTVKMAAIDQNFRDLPGTPNPGLDGWRGSVETKGKFSLASWWSFGWDVTFESDDTFRRFYKLDNILQSDRVNSVYLRGLGERSYFAMTGYHFGSLLFDGTPTASTSVVHPVVDWNYVVGQPVAGGELSWNVNAYSLTRETTYAAGQRGTVSKISADTGWRRRLTDRIGITYTPFANLRGDVYSLEDVNDPANPGTALDGTVSRGVASAGVLVAYPWARHDAGGSHIVEPLGQMIVRTKRTGNRAVPDEDARSIVFDDTNLFEVDKFSGYDRIETGTRANVGLQYTFQANGGGYARLLAGQSFHLSGTNPFTQPGQASTAATDFDFNPASGLETRQSDYVLAAYLSPSKLFRLIGQARIDDTSMTLRRADVFAQADLGPLFAQANYAFTSAQPLIGINSDQQDIHGLLGFRLTDNWSVIGAMRYDIDSGERIQDSITLRYADECFVLTAAYTETFITDPARGLNPDQTVMLRFELKHLGGVRYKTDVLDTFFAPNQPSAN
ncbi:MAG: LPS assembly protein LptD [Hyphomicrobiaceae bacterium]